MAFDTRQWTEQKISAQHRHCGSVGRVEAHLVSEPYSLNLSYSAAPCLQNITITWPIEYTWRLTTACLVLSWPTGMWTIYRRLSPLGKPSTSQVKISWRASLSACVVYESKPRKLLKIIISRWREWNGVWRAQFGDSSLNLSPNSHPDYKCSTRRS